MNEMYLLSERSEIKKLYPNIIYKKRNELEEEWELFIWDHYNELCKKRRKKKEYYIEEHGHSNIDDVLTDGYMFEFRKF